MSADLLALLDQLDEARAAATPGEWAQVSADDRYVIGDISDDGESYLDVADVESSSDAALIVAAVNALPKLTAALRAALTLADDYDDGSEWGMATHPGHAIRDRIRAAITAALTPEQVQP